MAACRIRKLTCLLPNFSYLFPILRAVNSKPVLLNTTHASKFSTTFSKFVKEIRETKDGNVTVIEGVHVESPRAGNVVEIDDPHGSCPLCRLGLRVQFSDVLIIKQFLTEDGFLLPRSATGLCTMQQRRIKRVLAQAQKAGLMRCLRPFGMPEGKRQQRNWKKFNTYYPNPDWMSHNQEEWRHVQKAETRRMVKWRNELRDRLLAGKVS